MVLRVLYDINVRKIKLTPQTYYIIIQVKNFLDFKSQDDFDILEIIKQI